MLDDILFAFKVFGTKEIIAYVIIIVAIIAFGVYMRSVSARR